MTKILVLIWTVINIKLPTAQQLTFPQQLQMISCNLYYEVGNPTNIGPYTTACLTGSPCDCSSTPFHYTLLEETNLNDFLQLSDNSWIDFTVRLGSIGTYYRLSLIEIGWHNLSQYADTAKTFVSVLDPNTNEWMNVSCTQSNIGNNPQFEKYDITRILCDGSNLVNSLVDQVRVHIEWNTPTPDGLIRPAYFTVNGAMDTKNPTEAPSVSTYNPTQTPTESPTPNGLVQVSLDGLHCCDPKDINSYSWYHTYNETGVNISRSIDCCYPDRFVTWTIGGGDFSFEWQCQSSNGSYPNGGVPTFNPDIETFCGIDQFRSNYSIPRPLNIMGRSAVYAINEGTTYECRCNVEYPDFIWNNDSEFRCSNGNNNNYCLSPGGITGYVNHLSAIDSVDGNYCNCNYTYNYLEWTIGVNQDINVDQQFWNYISWDTGYLTNHSMNDSCLFVKVKRCNNNKQCVFETSYQSVDTAMSFFQTGDYLQSLSTNCYCYQMYNKCITTNEPTTFAPTTSEPTTTNPTTSDPTTANPITTTTDSTIADETAAESTTAKATEETDDTDNAFKSDVPLKYSTLVLILKYLLN